jgi:hypothetical protein
VRRRLLLADARLYDGDQLRPLVPHRLLVPYPPLGRQPREQVDVRLQHAQRRAGVDRLDRRGQLQPAARRGARARRAAGLGGGRGGGKRGGAAGREGGGDEGAVVVGAHGAAADEQQRLQRGLVVAGQRVGHAAGQLGGEGRGCVHSYVVGSGVSLNACTHV